MLSLQRILIFDSARFDEKVFFHTNANSERTNAIRVTLFNKLPARQNRGQPCGQAADRRRTTVDKRSGIRWPRAMWGRGNYMIRWSLYDQLLPNLSPWPKILSALRRVVFRPKSPENDPKSAEINYLTTTDVSFCATFRVVLTSPSVRGGSLYERCGEANAKHKVPTLSPASIRRFRDG